MRNILGIFLALALSFAAHAASQYDGIWLETGADDHDPSQTYTVYSMIHTTANGAMYKVDVEPANGQPLTGEWIGTQYGTLTANVATMSGEGDNCYLSHTMRFTSATTATITVTNASPKPGKTCPVGNGFTVTLQKLL
jgi:hypothetical protein